MKCLVFPALCIVAVASFQQMPFTTRPRLMMNGSGMKTNCSPLFSSDRDESLHYSQEELDNHADEMNPNNDEYGGDDDDDDDDDSLDLSQFPRCKISALLRNTTTTKTNPLELNHSRTLPLSRCKIPA
jgi:hypothetical protein